MQIIFICLLICFVSDFVLGQISKKKKLKKAKETAIMQNVINSEEVSTDETEHNN